MRTTFKKRIPAFLAFLMLAGCLFTTTAFAKDETILLPQSQIWAVRSSIERTGKYSYVEAKVNSVYPVNGGIDTFTKVQVKVYTDALKTFSNTYTLSETSSSSTQIALNEGFLDEDNVKLAFRGNNADYSAYANVTYYAE